MDQSNQTPPIEIPTTPVADDPGYKYEDVHNPSIREIAVESPEEKKEEPVAPPAVEEPPKVEEVKEPEIPLEEVGQKIAIEAAKQVIEEQKAAEKAAIEAAKPQEDEYTTWEKDFAEKQGKPPTYKEALKFVSEQTERLIEEKQRVKTEEAARLTSQQEAAREQQLKVVTDYIDNEITDLIASSKLTPIKDKNNPSDQGIIEQKALYQKMMEVNQERIAQNKQPIYSIKTIFYENFTKPIAQPPGADAPISTRRGTATPPGAQPDTYSYKEIHKPWSLFKQRS